MWLCKWKKLLNEVNAYGLYNNGELRIHQFICFSNSGQFYFKGNKTGIHELVSLFVSEISFRKWWSLHSYLHLFCLIHYLFFSNTLVRFYSSALTSKDKQRCRICTDLPKWFICFYIYCTCHDINSAYLLLTIVYISTVSS